MPQAESQDCSVHDKTKVGELWFARRDELSQPVLITTCTGLELERPSLDPCCGSACLPAIPAFFSGDPWF